MWRLGRCRGGARPREEKQEQSTRAACTSGSCTRRDRALHVGGLALRAQSGDRDAWREVDQEAGSMHASGRAPPPPPPPPAAARERLLAFARIAGSHPAHASSAPRPTARLMAARIVRGAGRGRCASLWGLGRATNARAATPARRANMGDTADSGLAARMGRNGARRPRRARCDGRRAAAAASIVVQHSPLLPSAPPPRYRCQLRHSSMWWSGGWRQWGKLGGSDSIDWRSGRAAPVRRRAARCVGGNRGD